MVGTFCDAVIMTFSLLRICIASCMLGYGSYSDVKTRGVSDALWLTMAVSGLFLASLELFMGSLTPFQVFKSLLVGGILASLLYIFNFGGADVKAIISISFLFPNSLSLYLPAFHLHLPMMGGPTPPFDIFVLSILTNSLLIALLVPLSLFLYNLCKRDISPLMFLGYKVEISSLRRKRNFRLMHEIKRKGIEIERRYIWRGIEPTEERLSFLGDLEREKRIKEVWVTPEPPFIVYLTTGFFTTVFYGDFISSFFF